MQLSIPCILCRICTSYSTLVHYRCDGVEYRALGCCCVRFGLPLEQCCCRRRCRRRRPERESRCGSCAPDTRTPAPTDACRSASRTRRNCSPIALRCTARMLIELTVQNLFLFYSHYFMMELLSIPTTNTFPIPMLFRFLLVARYSLLHSTWRFPRLWSSPLTADKFDREQNEAICSSLDTNPEVLYRRGLRLRYTRLGITTIR